MQQRIAVRTGAGDVGGAENAVGAGLVDDDEGLAEPGREAVGEHAAQDVRARSGRGGRDNLNDALWVALRRRPGRGADCHDRLVVRHAAKPAAAVPPFRIVPSLLSRNRKR